MSADGLPMVLTSLGLAELVFPEQALRWRYERSPYDPLFGGFMAPAPAKPGSG